MPKIISKKILVIDSDETVFDLYKTALEEEFILFNSCTNKDARFKTSNDQFSVIITDLKLSDGMATDTIKNIREFGLNKETPILVISDIGDRILSEFSGIKDFHALKKTPSNEMLRIKVKELCKKDMSIDVKLINPIIESTIKTLETMTKVTAKEGKPYLKKGNEVSGDISGIIGVISSTYEGSIAISFTTSLFLVVVSKMLGEEQTQITDEIKDAVAELINIIFGQAKKTLNEQGYELEKSLPSIVKGESHVIKYPSNYPVIVIPFVTPLGNFRVEVCASEKKKKSN